MKPILKSLTTLVGALFALGLGSTQAEDNTTTIISNVTSNHAGADYYVGNTGSSNYLQIDSSGQLVNVNFGYIGFAAAANANAALVTGADSTFLAANQFRLGNSGDSNSLTVADGGNVAGLRIAFGQNAGSDYNHALVTGTNSILQASTDALGNVLVGRGGSWNSLTISNGGKVTGGSGANPMVVGNLAGANHNSALITGPGSVWTGDNGFTVGLSAAFNSMTISNGGAVNVLSDLVVGNVSSANNNSVLVTGAGSIWSGFAVLYVGAFAPSNSLTIADGGTVLSAIGQIGAQTGGHKNSVIVTGTGSAWTNDTFITMGAAGGASSNNLTVAAGGAVVAVAGDFNIGTGAASAGNAALVSGANSVLEIGGATVIGSPSSGQGNSLTVSSDGLAKVRNVLVAEATARLIINAGVLQAQTSHNAFISAAAGKAYIQSGGAAIDSNGQLIRIPTPLEEDSSSLGGGLMKIGSGTLELSATNTYTGPTTVEAGTLGGNGALLSSSLVVKSGAALAPGNQGIGTLAVAGGVTNEPGSTTVMEITSDSGAGDRLISSNNIALNGTLVVTNLGAGAFTNGQTFTLFQSLVGVSGNFTATNLPALSGNLIWAWSPASGTLTVVSPLSTTPTNITFSVSGGTLELSWPESHLGWYAQSNSLDVADMNAWFDIEDSQTATNLSITLDPALTNVYYRLRLP